MIDKLLLRCYFRDPDCFSLEKLRIPLQGSIDPDGQLHHLRHPWECIPSSFTDMAFKVNDFNPDRPDPDPFIEIKASPAKLSQGHNVYGSDDLYDCSMVLIGLLCETYPGLVELLDYSSWELVEVDITYHSWADSERAARQFIDALANVSNGQTRSRTGFSGTAYFGKKNSRIKKLKVYDKFREVTEYLKSRKGTKNDPSRFYSPQLLDWCKGMIRWESTLKKRWFERRDIPTKLIDLVKVFDAKAYWVESTKDIFDALAGEQMKILKDDEVLKALMAHFPTVNANTGKTSYGKANAAYRTYRAIKADGYCQVKETMERTSFWRHIEMLTSCGLSKALLQNMQGEGLKAEVIPMVRYAVVEFRNQFPDWLYKVA